MYAVWPRATGVRRGADLFYIFLMSDIWNVYITRLTSTNITPTQLLLPVCLAVGYSWGRGGCILCSGEGQNWGWDWQELPGVAQRGRGACNSYTWRLFYLKTVVQSDFWIQLKNTTKNVSYVRSLRLSLNPVLRSTQTARRCRSMSTWFK